MEALRQEKLQEETVRAAADKAEKEDSDSRQAPDILPEITIDDFAKGGFEGKGCKGRAVEKADKLLKLTLDVGGNPARWFSALLSITVLRNWRHVCHPGCKPETREAERYPIRGHDSGSVR